MDKLFNISEVSKILNLIDPSTKKPLNYILRYWEKEFKIIRPLKIRNRRYYSSKQLEIIKMIKFYLKNKGMTISGVKSLILTNINKLDDDKFIGLKDQYLKAKLKKKKQNYIRKDKKIEKKWQKKLILKFVWFLKAILIVSLFIMQKNLQKEKRLKKN